MSQDQLVNAEFVAGGTSRGGNRHAVDALPQGRRVCDAVAAAGLVGVAGCSASAPSATPTRAPAPYLSKYEHGITIDHPITCKNRYPDAGRLDFGTVGWKFCFDHAGEGWVRVPVSSTDYEYFDIGDRVRLRQETGQFAVIVAN